MQIQIVIRPAEESDLDKIVEIYERNGGAKKWTQYVTLMMNQLLFQVL